MNTSDLLNDYEQFASYFQSLDTDENTPEPADLDSILESLTEEDHS